LFSLKRLVIYRILVVFSQNAIWIIALAINPQKESGLLLKYMND